MFGRVQATVPKGESFDTVASTTDVTNLALSETGDTGEPFNGRRYVALPPFLTRICMASDTEDAGALLLHVRKALQDFDAPTGLLSDDEAVEETKEPDPPSATATFKHILQFLWLVANGTMSSHPIEPITTSRANDWAATVAVGKIIPRVTPDHSPAAGQPPHDSHPTLSQLGPVISRLADSMDAYTTRQTQSETDKSKNKFPKFPEWTRRMILHASEPLADDLTDDNGDPVTERTSPVDTYSALLDQKTTAEVKQYLDHYLNDVKQCAANIPMATCQAILMGKFRWSNIESPEAFSVLACFHSAADGVNSNEINAMELQMKAVEGVGLSDADVLKATKLVLAAPKTIDDLAKQLSVLAMLLTCVLGAEATITKEMIGWTSHIRDQEMSYRNLAGIDSAFPLKLACFIDKSMQFYFKNCAIAQSVEKVDDSPLGFTGVKRDIIMGTFTLAGVPRLLASQLKRPSAATDSGSSEPAADETPSKKKKRKRQQKEKGPVEHNPDVPPSCKVAGHEMKHLLSHVFKSPSWTNGDQLCLNYHCLGTCHGACPRASTHKPAPDAIRTALTTFVKDARRTAKGRGDHNTNADE